MNRLRVFGRRLRALFRRKAFDAEMAEEMRLHLELQATENVKRGMSPDEARYAARREFGGVEQIKENARDRRTWRWLDHLAQDLSYAVRSLRKQLGFSLTVVFTVALGIGACTGVYSVIDGLLLHPIGHDPHPENEVKLFETQLPKITDSRVSPANFLDWEKQAQSFSALRAGAPADLTLTGEGEPIRLTAARSTPRLLEVHGWTLAAGRGFLPEEDTPGRNKVIIVSYQIWQRMLGGDPRAIGRALQINGEPYTLVGVISEEVGRFSNADAFVPMALTDQERAQRGGRSLGVWARLKPGVTLEQARAEMNVLSAQLARQHPDTNQGWGASIITVVQIQGAGGLRQALWTLLGAVGCVLLIACANVANLLLARASVRQREMAVRAALGAGRGRLLRQLLTESLLLALLGGAAGVLLAHWGLQAVHAYAGRGMQRLGYVELDLGMLGVALGLSVATGVIFGLAPAWIAARVDLNEALKQGARGSTESGARGRLRGTLVIVEVALALVLLAGSGALIRRLTERANSNPGFVAENASVMQVNLSRKKYPGASKQVAFVDGVLERLQGLPGVQAVGVTTALPIFQFGPRYEIEGQPPRARDEWPNASVYGVTPDYFPAMGVRLLRGRTFTAADRERAPRVVIVNETLAAQFFPNENPIGRRIRPAAAEDGVWREIVGVVNDVMQFGNAADTAVIAQCYEPFAQRPSTNFYFIVRAVTGRSGVVLPLLKPQVYAVDANQPVGFLLSLQDVIDERLAGARFAMHLLSVFSIVALAIAAVGIYAVVAYAVSQRTTEIGIRMALGAGTRDVLRLLLGFGGRLVGWGLLAGIVASLALGRGLEAMLYNASARDPLVLTAITVLLAGVALLACLIPARRATKVDPMVALRCE